MLTLYLDNFRGFSETLINFSEVNFLVGENSTGKTSILKLLNLLNDQELNFTMNFNAHKHDLGTFNDIISASSSNRKNFKIGIIEKTRGKSKSDSFNYKITLMKFKEDEGLPKIEQVFLLDKYNVLTINFSENKIKYKIDKFSFSNNFNSDIKKLLELWKKNENHIHEFKNLNWKFHTSKDANILFLPIIILEIQSKEKNNKTEIGDFPNLLPFTSSDSFLTDPIRSEPQRTYDESKISRSPEGEHIPYLLRKLLKDEDKDFENFIIKFGKKSGLFKKIIVKNYGDNPEAPFEIDIILDKEPINFKYVGYGVSQSLPIIVDSFINPSGILFLIQQPEVHLHPKAQAALGDLFFDLSSIHKKEFYIETHSEFIIDRFRQRIRKRKNIKFKSKVLYFKRENGFNKVYEIDIDKNGDYSEDQPKEFKEFFINEELNNLGLGD